MTELEYMKQTARKFIEAAREADNAKQVSIAVPSVYATEFGLRLEYFISHHENLLELLDSLEEKNDTNKH